MLLLLESDFDATRVAAVLVVVLWLELSLLFQDELWALFVLLLLALLEAEALCEALLSLSDLADCAALDDAEFVVAFAFLALLDDELTFELELSAAADWLALFAVLASLVAAFLLELLDDALLDDFALPDAAESLADAL